MFVYGYVPLYSVHFGTTISFTAYIFIVITDWVNPQIVLKQGIFLLRKMFELFYVV